MSEQQLKKNNYEETKNIITFDKTETKETLTAT